MGTGKTVLVIEDDADMREAFADVLSLDGHRTRLASGGEEGLRILEQEPIHLILLDMVMPKMSGEEFLELLRADPRWTDVPVVATTALPVREPPEDAVALLPKPFDSDALSDVVTRYTR
jgi:CheY-like chemotaxis protein